MEVGVTIPFTDEETKAQRLNDLPEVDIFFLFEHNLSLLPKGNHYSEPSHQGFAFLFLLSLSFYYLSIHS